MVTKLSTLASGKVWKEMWDSIFSMFSIRLSATVHRVVFLQFWCNITGNFWGAFHNICLIEVFNWAVVESNQAITFVLVFLQFEIGWVVELVSNWFGLSLNDTQLIPPYQAIYSKCFYRPSHTRPLCLGLLCHCNMQLKLHIACRSVIHERYQHTPSCCLFQKQEYHSKEQHLHIDAVVKSRDLLDAAVVSPGENWYHDFASNLGNHKLLGWKLNC